MKYSDFLKEKLKTKEFSGFNIDPQELNPLLFQFKRDIVCWSLKKGKSAIFAGCGLGKTFIQLEWAKAVCAHTGGNVLILAPLAVSYQTVGEGEKLGIVVNHCRTGEDVNPGINITNYEMLDHFSPAYFQGIVLDESSILKSFSGKFRNQIISSFAHTPYRLACTATPSPNDYMELGNHSEFLGAMTYTEMLSMFFVHDGGETSKWRLKRHAEKKFWEWISSWAVMLEKPSDLGYEDNGFILPELIITQVTVKTKNRGEYLFNLEAQTLQERQQARRESIPERISKAGEIIGDSPESWLIWCNLNTESNSLKKGISGSEEIVGSDSPEFKQETLHKFINGDLKRLVTKPSIAGFGLNLQICHNIVFLGLSDSFEQYYQAVRRCWRFGQKEPVNVYIITAEQEGAVKQNIINKERRFKKMMEGMISNTQDLTKANLHDGQEPESPYMSREVQGNNWKMVLGDCVEESAKIPSDSVHYSVFSPPFASLYTYSDSDRDMGNCKGISDFGVHFKFFIKELYRILMPGRLVSFHCMNLPISKERFGYIGLQDFRGELIRWFQEEGFIYHSEVVIWKDPVMAAHRTKALGLMYKQLQKDSAMSRQGVPDYLVTMRKPGENSEPVHHTKDEFPLPLWQNYASPVWMDINPSDTLQRTSAREEKDEKHICPLQLEVIERALKLWTNPGDLVLSPFAGIGSEGYVSLQQGRRFLGIELKNSYFAQAIANLKMAENKQEQPELFDVAVV